MEVGRRREIHYRPLNHSFCQSVATALIKVDTEGFELEALRDILSLAKKGRKVHNILVEFTPKWWPEGKSEGLKVVEEYVKSSWTFFSSPWSEHAARVGRPPHGLSPEGVSIDWDKEPLLFVQRIPPSSVAKYIDSIKYQRDMWLQHADTPFPLNLVKNEVSDVQCMNADEWKYHRMPSYLSDKVNVDTCLDFYHGKK